MGLSPRHVRPLDPANLGDLSTERLLAYRNRMLALEDTAKGSDWAEDELNKLEEELIYFKDDPRWRPLYDAVKAALGSREHVEK